MTLKIPPSLHEQTRAEEKSVWHNAEHFEWLHNTVKITWKLKMVKAMKYVAEGKTSWEPMDFGTMTFLCEWKKWAFESKLNFVCYVRKLEQEVATLQTEVLFKCSFLSSRYTKDIRVNGLRTVWQVPKIIFRSEEIVYCVWYMYGISNVPSVQKW